MAVNFLSITSVEAIRLQETHQQLKGARRAPKREDGVNPYRRIQRKNRLYHLIRYAVLAVACVALWFLNAPLLLVAVVAGVGRWVFYPSATSNMSNTAKTPNQKPNNHKNDTQPQTNLEKHIVYINGKACSRKFMENLGVSEKELEKLSSTSKKPRK